jgi:release factor glutamine methyltransferase
MHIHELLCRAAGVLGAVSATPRLDAELLLAWVLHCGRARLLAAGDVDVAPRKAERFEELVERRRRGLPVAYLTGSREFYGRPYLVSPAVLPPKADTELLVERALISLGGLEGGAEPTVCDLCTGTGCVGLSVLLESPLPLTLTLTDTDGAALRVARENARRLLPERPRCFATAKLVGRQSRPPLPVGRGRVRFLCSDLFAAFPAGARFHLVTANPPYVPSALARRLLSDGRGEPLIALDGGPDGLALVRRLVTKARPRLHPGGTLLLEVGDGQAAAVAALLAEAGYHHIAARRDLTGMDRVVEGSI